MTVILDGQMEDKDAPKQSYDQEYHPNNPYPYTSELWSPFWYWTDIPIPLCDLILNTCKKSEHEEYHPAGSIGAYKEPTKKFRQSDIVFRTVEWVNALMYGYIHKANYYNFGYDLSKFDHEEIQMTKYKKGDYYKKHIDFGYDRNQRAHTRKLSSTLQLSDSDEYEGGDLIFHIDGFVQHEDTVKVPRNKGTLVVFDSRLPHEVTPITSGNRYSVVKWVCGDNPLQ